VSGRCHHADAIADEEHHRYALELLSASGAVRLGRRTFELFESFWPQAEQRADLPRYMTEFAAALNATPKYVVSSRTVATEWRNHGRFADEIVTRCVGMSSSSRSKAAPAASLRTDLPSCCAAAR
jgi:hypothetical protein